MAFNRADDLEGRHKPITYIKIGNPEDYKTKLEKFEFQGNCIGRIDNLITEVQEIDRGLRIRLGESSDEYKRIKDKTDEIIDRLREYGDICANSL